MEIVGLAGSRKVGPAQKGYSDFATTKRGSPTAKGLSRMHDNLVTLLMESMKNDRQQLYLSEKVLSNFNSPKVKLSCSHGSSDRIPIYEQNHTRQHNSCGR
jgi:hypothetical protein